MIQSIYPPKCLPRTQENLDHFCFRRGPFGIKSEAVLYSPGALPKADNMASRGFQSASSACKHSQVITMRCFGIILFPKTTFSMMYHTKPIFVVLSKNGFKSMCRLQEAWVRLPRGYRELSKRFKRFLDTYKMSYLCFYQKMAGS